MNFLIQFLAWEGAAAYAAYAAIAASLVSAGVSYYGQQQAAKTAERNAAYNANLAKREAERRNRVAQENARRKAAEHARFMAAQRAKVAGANLALEGSPIAILGESAAKLERDLLDLSYNNAVESDVLRQRATLTLMEGKATASSYRTSSYATLLEGAGNAAGGAAKLI